MHTGIILYLPVPAVIAVVVLGTLGLVGRGSLGFGGLGLEGLGVGWRRSCTTGLGVGVLELGLWGIELIIIIAGCS